MYKIILISIFLCLILIGSTCKPQDNLPKPAQIDSCAILTKMINEGWYYKPNLGVYRDSFNMSYMWLFHPAFRECFSKMSEGNVKTIFGAPQDSGYLGGNGNDNIILTKYYRYYTVKNDKEERMTDFDFRNGYLIEVGGSISSIVE